MNNLLMLIDELGSKIPYWSKLDNSVSQSSIGWHIQHTLLATKKILIAVESSDPKKYKWKFNLTRSIVFTLNRIPRGRGKAPKSVIPNEPFEVSAILNEMEALKTRIRLLDRLNSNSHFEHPYFGSLNLKTTIKFLEIHTKHHIAIINEIIK